MTTEPSRRANSTEGSRGSLWKVLLAWLAVTTPLLWGVWQTVKKAAVLFR
jgi:hypothetical protein